MLRDTNEPLGGSVDDSVSSSSQDERPYELLQTWAVSNSPIRKRLEFTGADGVFRKPGERRNQLEVPERYRFGAVVGTPTIEALYETRCELAALSNHTIITGMPSAALMDGAIEVGGDDWGNICVVSPDWHPRVKANFTDPPQRVLRFDLDGLDGRRYCPDYHAVWDIAETGNVLRDFFEEIDVPWLIEGMVFHASSRHGLSDTHSVRGHLEFVLKDCCALTLGETQALANLLNDRCEVLGLPRVLDTKIYEPGHLLLTAPPSCYDAATKQDVQPPKFEHVHLFRPCIPQLRPKGALVEIPEDILTAVRALAAKPTRSRPPKRISSKKVAVGEPKGSPKYARATVHNYREALIADIRLGNTDAPIRDLIFSVARMERADRVQVVMEYWRKRAIDRIVETSPDGAKATDRIRDHASPEHWADSFDRALTKFPRIPGVVAQQSLPRLPTRGAKPQRSGTPGR